MTHKIKIICILISFLSFNFLKITAQNLDIQILSNIHADSSKFGDKTASILSKSAAPLAVVNPLTLIITGFVKKDDLLKREGYRSAAALALNSTLTVGLKYAVNRKRPFVSYPEKLNPKAHVGPFSFPSGHTSTAFSMATSLTLASKKWYVAVPAYLWASGVAYSRMYLGVHYPSDLLVGILIGVGTSFLTWKIDQLILLKK
jgi:membrane-associated phospholipid phosphatase